MRLLRRALLVLAVLVVALLGVVMMQPSQFRVARTTTMTASAAAVFAEVNDFRRWQAWNPWATLDPAMAHRYEGPPAGVGAVYTWAGTGEVGEGRMTLTESRPDELIRIRLEFLRPFPGTSTAEFTFRPEGDRTAVTWSMTGTNDVVAKAIHLFVDMDRMIGGQFDRGLARMKAVVEAAPRG